MFITNQDEITGWAVTDQAADQIVTTQAGDVVSGTYVYFATQQGNKGSVFVPDQHYTRDNVHKSVSARARLMDEIGNLVA